MLRNHAVFPFSKNARLRLVRTGSVNGLIIDKHLLTVALVSVGCAKSTADNWIAKDAVDDR